MLHACRLFAQNEAFTPLSPRHISIRLYPRFTRQRAVLFEIGYRVTLRGKLILIRGFAVTASYNTTYA